MPVDCREMGIMNLPPNDLKDLNPGLYAKHPDDKINCGEVVASEVATFCPAATWRA